MVNSSPKAMENQDCCRNKLNVKSVRQQNSSLQCKNSVTSLTAQINALKSNLNKQKGVSLNIVPPVFQKPNQTELVRVTARISGILKKPSFGKGGGKGGKGNKGKKLMALSSQCQLL